MTGYTKETIRDWYGGRTEHILERYGGDAPRVHYHTGLVSELPDTQEIDELKRLLRQGQVRLLDVAAKEWQIERLKGGNILDSGCGLGGGSIYWAEKYDCQVTGVSLVRNISIWSTSMRAKLGSLSESILFSVTCMKLMCSRTKEINTMLS